MTDEKNGQGQDPEVGSQSVEDLPEETKAEKKKREKEEERQKKIEEKEEKERKEELFQQYNDVLGKVQSLQDMTGTTAWRSLYQYLMSLLAAAKEELVEAKGAGISQHQQRVKVVREILEHVQAPIEHLNAFVGTAPLFAPTDLRRAEWNKALGVVILRKLG